MAKKSVFLMLLGAALFCGYALDSSSAAQPGAFALTVTIPQDGQKFATTLIPVAGVTVPGALVMVSDITVPVDSAGNFTGKIPIPDEKAQFDFTITASLHGRKQVVTRRIQYAPSLAVILRTPKQGQIITDTAIAVSGEVIPEKATLTINGKKIAVAPGGFFAGTCSITDKEQEVKLECVVTMGSKIETLRRTVIYKRAGDDSRPVIQPMTLPAIAKQNKLYFSVVDRTPNEEITFYREIDGMKESETGQPNAQFVLPVEEGIHSYTIYAEDKQKNRSSLVRGEIKYLSRPFAIKIKHPLASERLALRPGQEASGVTTTVSFTVHNLPDDNPKLLKEVTVTNSANGATAAQRDPVNTDFEFDLEVDGSRQNVFTIAVRDINDRIITAQASIRIR